MGRITISIPDELEELLDAYAVDKGVPVSQVVAQALSRFLQAPGEPGPVPSPPPRRDEDLVDLQEYVALLGVFTERLRQTLETVVLFCPGTPPGTGVRIPRPLPPPPWRATEGSELLET